MGQGHLGHALARFKCIQGQQQPQPLAPLAKAQAGLLLEQTGQGALGRPRLGRPFGHPACDGLELGHALGMQVTAEGIESQRELLTLRDMGCDLAQGYLLGRPSEATELAAIIMRNFAFQLARASRAAAAPDTTQTV